jgi:hypothetical protein
VGTRRRVGVSGRRLLEPAEAASLFETHPAKPWRTVNNRPFTPLLGSTRVENHPVHVAATTMMIVPVLIVIVMAAESLLLLVTAMANRPQERIEGLRRDLSPFLARR